MKNIFAVMTALTLSTSAFASGDHSAPEAGPERFGPGKAIEAFSKEDGFKLSAKATKNLGVKFESISGNGPWKIPQASLVRIKQSAGVYRKYEGWISLVLVKVLQEGNGAALIQSPDLEPGDEVAVAGSHYLRMTDSDLNAGTVDSCSH